jgi:hypothetical protein
MDFGKSELITTLFIIIELTLYFAMRIMNTKKEVTIYKYKYKYKI